MAERKNTGQAFIDAKRLNNCFNELSEAIAARPPMKGDRDLLDKRLRPMGDWATYCASDGMAAAKVTPIRSAI